MSFWIKLVLVALASLAIAMGLYRLTHLADPIVPTAVISPIVPFTAVATPMAIAPLAIQALATPAPPVVSTHIGQTAHVIITRRTSAAHGDAGASETIDPAEVIDIYVAQDGSASAPVVVVTPAPLPSVAPMALASPVAAPNADRDHSRLGLVVGTFPGILALDVQIVRLHPLAPLAAWRLVPQSVGGLEASLDAEANLKQAGLVVTTGSKLFAGVGYYSTPDLSSGWMVGAGLRF